MVNPTARSPRSISSTTKGMPMHPLRPTRATCCVAILCTMATLAIAAPADEPTLQHYRLILPENLPNLMQSMQGRGKELGIDGRQKASLAALVLEVRDRLQPLLGEARTLEKTLAGEALAGATPTALGERLDLLQQLKRTALEAHIDGLNRLRRILTATQYEQLLRIDAGQRTGAETATRLLGSEAAASGVLRLLDDGRHAEAWATAAPLFRARTGREDWLRAAQAARAPLGVAGTRRLRALTHATALPGLPDDAGGDYATYVYDSDFAERRGVAESVVLARDADGVWRLAGYFIQ